MKLQPYLLLLYNYCAIVLFLWWYLTPALTNQEEYDPLKWDQINRIVQMISTKPSYYLEYKV